MTIKIDTKIIQYGGIGLGIMLFGGIIYYFRNPSTTTSDPADTDYISQLISKGYTKEEAERMVRNDSSDYSWSGGASLKIKKLKLKKNKKFKKTKKLKK